MGGVTFISALQIISSEKNEMVYAANCISSWLEEANATWMAVVIWYLIGQKSVMKNKKIVTR